MSSPGAFNPEPSATHVLRGFQDILPPDYDYFTMVKKVVRHRGRQAGFRRIATPFLERTALFQSALGDSSTIAQELFSLELEEGSVSLKPEETTGIARAYIEHRMTELPQPVQLYYIEPHFRRVDLQRSKHCQFHQFGFVVFGGHDPSIEAQILHLSSKILQDLRIFDHFLLQINAIGGPKVRENYNAALRNYFYGKERHLPPELGAQLEKNPLRLLESENEDVKILVSMAPKLADYLDAETIAHYEEMKEFLQELEIPFVENKALAPALEYYSDVVFEFRDKNDSSHKAVGGGGRYDGLVETLQGPATPAVGIAFEAEGIIAYMKAEEIEPPQKDKIHVFVAQLSGIAKKKAMRILGELHDRGVHAMGATGKASMKHQLALADQFQVDWAILIGEVEVRDGTAILRNMQAGTQEVVPLEQVVDKMVELIGVKNLDYYRLGE